MTIRVIAVNVALAAFLGAPFANASDFWLGLRGVSQHEPGKVYVGLGGSGGIYNLPKFQAFDVFQPFPNRVGRFSYDPAVAVGGPGGMVGYVFPTGIFPAWAGSNVRLDLSGSYWRGRTTDNNGFGSSQVNLRSVDGTVNFLSFNFDLPSRLRTEFRAFEVALRMSSDYRISQDIFLTPSIAVFGGQSTERYFLQYDLVSTMTGLANPGSLNERNRTTRLGGEIGVSLSYQLSPAFKVQLGGRAAVVHLQTRLRASDCQQGSVTFAVGTDCGSTSPATIFYQTSASDSASKTGFRGVLSGGVSFNTDWAVFALGVFGTHESDVPGVRNPSVANPAPASIIFDSAWNFGGYATVRIPFL